MHERETVGLFTKLTDGTWDESGYSHTISKSWFALSCHKGAEDASDFHLAARIKVEFAPSKATNPPAKTATVHRKDHLWFKPLVIAEYHLKWPQSAKTACCCLWQETLSPLLQACVHRMKSDAILRGTDEMMTKSIICNKYVMLDTIAKWLQCQ